MTSITRAREVQEKRKQALKDGSAGIRKQSQPRLLSVAAQEWLEVKKLGWSPRMADIARTSMGHFLPLVGKRLLVDIEASDISKYQGMRLDEGASNRTVNIEVGILRQIMRKYGMWARIQPDVQMLPERQDVGQALSAEDESALLLECGRSRSRILLPFVVTAMETGARFNTIRTLQWKNINFGSRCLQLGKDKTRAGTGRVVPLNLRAFAALTFWAQQFPNRCPEHYVFPLERCNKTGTKDTFGFTGDLVYVTDPTQPIGDVKEAWEGAKRRTRRHCPKCNTGILADKQEPETGYACVSCNFVTQVLPAGLVSVRFHDLRHSAVTRMIAARIPLPIIAKIVGWTHGTMAKMAARYGHFGIEELREAVETISSNVIEGPVLDAGSLQFSLQRQLVSESSHRN